MAGQDMRETVTKVGYQCIPNGYSLKITDLQEMYLRIRIGDREQAIKAIEELYRYGFVKGVRAAHNKRVGRI